MVIVSRETSEDSWSSSKGAQSVTFNEQNKLVKDFFRTHSEIKIDGLYTTLVPTKA